MRKTYKWLENSNIPTKDLVGLYADVQWSAYTKDEAQLAKALKNSLYHVSVWDEEKLIALIRVIGDDASILYIQDILVKKTYQNEGIGSELLRHVLEKYQNIRQIVLNTDNTAKTASFYEKNGLTNVANMDGVCFIKYNFEA